MRTAVKRSVRLLTWEDKQCGAMKVADARKPFVALPDDNAQHNPRPREVREWGGGRAGATRCHQRLG